MKKIVLLSLIALCLPVAGSMAQGVNDDLYFTPSKNKKETKEKKAVEKPQEKTVTVIEVDTPATTNIYTTPGTTVVVQDRQGKTRDVDEYNRRYDARDNDFVMEDDTLFIREREYPALDGEWVGGFQGSQDDYEYAERIIRFRNPRYAIHISSPYYWDVVYGSSFMDWNIYTDGWYAYAFPTFSNRLWWNWRYGSLGFGWGYNPYYYGGFYGGYWGGYHGGYWGHYHGHYHPHYYGGGWGYHAPRNPVHYTNRQSIGNRTSIANRASGSTSNRSSYGTTTRQSNANRQSTSTRQSTSNRQSSVTQGNRQSGSGSGRVVGTRQTGERQGVSTRTDASSSRNSTYTRPSSTRNTSNGSGVTSSSDRRNTNSVGTGSSSGSSTRSSATPSSTNRSSTYNRGSSSTPSSSATRSNSSSSTVNRSNNNSSSTRSYSPSSSSSSSRSSGTSSGGSSRSSGGGGGSSSRSSGSSRR